MALHALDLAFRLTPWSSREHADYVAGRYGSLLQEPALAEEYRLKYVEKEKEFLKAYEEQRRLLREASKKADTPAQELPDPEKNEWDPRKRFGIKEQKAEPKKEEKKVEVKPAKKAKKVEIQ